MTPARIWLGGWRTARMGWRFDTLRASAASPKAKALLFAWQQERDPRVPPEAPLDGSDLVAGGAR